MALGTRIETYDDVVVLVLASDFDLASAPEIRSAVQRTIDDGWKNLVFDLSRCAFIDSAGLGTILSTLRRAKNVGGTLQLVVPAQLHRTFELCELDKIFKMHNRIADIKGMDVSVETNT